MVWDVAHVAGSGRVCVWFMPAGTTRRWPQFERPVRATKPITSDFLHAACDPENALFDAVEIILKGKEAELPQGKSFTDKEGHIRTATRTRWYMSPHGQTYRTYALTDNIDCDDALERIGDRCCGTLSASMQSPCSLDITGCQAVEPNCWPKTSRAWITASPKAGFCVPTAGTESSS